MKVGLDISPLESEHKVRGIGKYTENLVEIFKNINRGLDFNFFKNSGSLPPVDIIHYPYFDLFFHTLPIHSKVRRVVTIHDVIPLVFPKYFPAGLKGGFNFFLQKKALENVDAVICDSNASKTDISKKLNYDEKKIHVIYLAPSKVFKKITDKAKLDYLIKKYKLPDKFVLYVGDVNWNKNISNLLDAISIAKANLVMVGKALVDDSLPAARMINAKITDLGIEDRVIKTGFVSDIELVGIYNLAQLTSLVSKYEGFGLPLLESMACGIPVVCSDVASLVEIGGDVAFYCNPNDVGDIAQKIKKVLSFSFEQRNHIRIKLINHAAKFSWEKVAKETINVYKIVNNEKV